MGAATSDFPSRFTRWLVGRNIQHVTSRAHPPTDQAEVERGHRPVGDLTWKDELFAQVPNRQAALDEQRPRYNTDYPATAADCDGQPPLCAHPTARFSGRPFDPALEWLLFDLNRVDAFLAQQVWVRHVGEQGQVGIGSDHYDLGREFFRWEVATVAAGALLGINPFDQPNVQESKDNTNTLLGEFRD